MGLAVKVPRRNAEELRRMLVREGVYDMRRRIVAEDDYVYIPVAKPFATEFEIVERELPSAEVESRPEKWSSFDIIGHIAVINDVDMSADEAYSVALEILKRHRRVRTVLQKTREVSGEMRVAEYRVLAGEAVTETVHRESGCMFKLDIAKVFFSPRLSTERLRVASQVKQSEKVLDMFAGVGPFSIIIAKRNPSAEVYSVEKNVVAYSYLLENIKLNKVVDRVKPFHGDALEVVPSLEAKFNRVIMNLPHKSLDFLEPVLRKTASNAVIHLYVAESREDGETTLRRVRDVCESLMVRCARVVKEISPRAVLKVYDLEMP